MAQFSLEIADTDVFRVLEAVAANYNRPETIFVDGEEVDNPESKAVFANKIVRNFLSENVKAYEIKLAKRAAAEAAEAAAEVTITDPQA